MTPNKTLVYNYYHQIVNTGDVTNIKDFISEEYSEDYNGIIHKIGIEGAVNHIIHVRKTYPDLHLNLERLLCEEDWVVTIYTMTGTHSLEWMGITPTHKKIRVTGVNIDRVINGKIVLHTGAANMLEPMIEIGAVRIV